MAGVDIKYKDATIATIQGGGSKTLKTGGKYCEDDITVDYVKEGITPSGAKDISANGIYDVSQYAVANVNVSAPAPTLIAKNITANGTYNASSDNADGYSEVTVNVPPGGEFIHTRDIVLDEDVAEIAIEFSENAIAAYLVCELPIISGSGNKEYIYPYYQGGNKKSYTETFLNFIGVGSFVIFNNSTSFFLANTSNSTINKNVGGVVDKKAIHKRIILDLYYADSVFATGGNIQIYECFKKGD